MRSLTAVRRYARAAMARICGGKAFPGDGDRLARHALFGPVDISMHRQLISEMALIFVVF